MRKLLVAAALTLALLGAIGAGSARTSATIRPVAAHAQLLADGGSTPYTPVCPGGGSTTCG